MEENKMDVAAEAADMLLNAGLDEKLIEEFSAYAHDVSRAMFEKVIKHMTEGNIRAAGQLPLIVLEQIVFDFVVSASNGPNKKDRVKIVMARMKDATQQAQRAI